MSDNRADGRGKTPEQRKIYNILDTLTRQELLELIMELEATQADVGGVLLLLLVSDEDLSLHVESFLAHFTRTADVNLPHAVGGGELVLERAMGLFPRAKYGLAVTLYLQILSAYLPILRELKDVKGNVGFLIDRSINGILNAVLQIAKGEYTEEYRLSVFREIKTEIKKPDYAKWFDWRADLLQACICLCESEVIRVEIEGTAEELIAALSGSEYYNKYVSGQLKEIRFSILKAFDGEKAQREFVLGNLSYDYFREVAIKTAMQDEDYEFALKLSGQRKWRAYLYEIYGKLEFKDKQADVARTLVLDNQEEYYEKFKSFFTAEEWETERVHLLEDLEAKDCPPVYFEIILEEEDKEKIFDFCEKYPEAVLDIYDKLIDIDAEKTKYYLRKYFMQFWLAHEEKDDSFFEEFNANYNIYEVLFGKVESDAFHKSLKKMK